MYNPFSLKDKTILITGASSGIGRATAVECSRMGAQLVITGRDEGRLAETMRMLEGENHLQIPGDLTDNDFIDRLASGIPPLDGFVNSAGIAHFSPFKHMTKDKLSEVFGINFDAPAFLTNALIRNKKIKKGGALVFISSTAGVVTSAVGLSLYSATKAAINGWVKGLALELAYIGVRVNTISPAMVETDLIHDGGTITKEQMDLDASKYPLKRYGKPEEIAYGAVYLLSDASGWSTGCNLLIDGGLTLL